MCRESPFPFLPAALAALTDAVTAAMVRANQPDYLQIVMFGAALLAAVFQASGCGSQGPCSCWPGCSSQGFRWGFLYLPTFFAVVWVMVRDGRPPVA
jgi:membrane-associated PAP2 superfamily phosphatase